MNVANATAAVSEALGVQLKSCSDVAGGEIHSCYRVGTDAGPFLLKVFHAPVNEAELHKLAWLDGALARAGVPRAELLYATTDDAIFPHGYTISSFLDGPNARQAVLQGRLSLEQYASQMGRLLRAVHEVTPPRRPWLGAPAHALADWEGTLTVLQKLVAVTSEELRPQAERALARLQREGATLAGELVACCPVPVHADPRAENAILTRDGLILVDWDNSRLAARETDLAGLLADEMFHERWGTPSPERRARIRDGFMAGYSARGGEYGAAIERLLGLGAGLHALWYRARRGEMDLAKRIAHRLDAFVTDWGGGTPVAP